VTTPKHVDGEAPSLAENAAAAGFCPEGSTVDDLRDSSIEADQQGARTGAAPAQAAVLARFFQPGTGFPQLYELADLSRYVSAEIANDQPH